MYRSTACALSLQVVVDITDSSNGIPWDLFLNWDTNILSEMSEVWNHMFQLQSRYGAVKLRITIIMGVYI